MLRKALRIGILSRIDGEKHTNDTGTDEQAGVQYAAVVDENKKATPNSRLKSPSVPPATHASKTQKGRGKKKIVEKFKFMEKVEKRAK